MLLFVLEFVLILSGPVSSDHLIAHSVKVAVSLQSHVKFCFVYIREIQDFSCVCLLTH